MQESRTLAWEGLQTPAKILSEMIPSLGFVKENKVKIRVLKAWLPSVLLAWMVPWSYKSPMVLCLISLRQWSERLGSIEEGSSRLLRPTKRR